MALKRLSSEEMIQVSASWVDPKSKAHKAILAQADLAPYLPRLLSAHDSVAACAQPSVEDPRLSQIRKQQGALDDRHDDIIRGAHLLLSGASFLLGEGGGADMITLRDILIPDGPSSVQKSYRAEAGQAAQLSGRLTPEIRAKLDAILIGPKTNKTPLGQFIEEWLSLGKQLGELEDEKARLQPVPADTGTGAGAALIKARNQWVRLVNAFVANAELAELDADTDALIFGPLRAAEKAAARRARSPEGPGDQGGTGTPPATGTPAVTGNG